MAEYTLLPGDCSSVLPLMYDAEFFDACVTDPPYGLNFMNKRWDYDVPSVDTWRVVLDVLKPGAWLLCFAGARTQHRMACNIEDAGFELRDVIMWVYGSGFPKSYNLTGDRAGWGTALKPAYEPIILARKPFKSTVSSNVSAHGTGALNIDACRVPRQDGDRTEYGVSGDEPSLPAKNTYGAWKNRTEYVPDEKGRWPANVVHSGLPEDWSRYFYCAKATKHDRDEGLSCEPKKQYSTDGRQTPIENAYQRNKSLAANNHPTVKPTDLMRWLCRLVTPPTGTILDPFCGSGSTGKGATLEGFDFVGIDIDPAYLSIAEKRIHHVINAGVVK